MSIVLREKGKERDHFAKSFANVKKMKTDPRNSPKFWRAGFFFGGEVGNKINGTTPAAARHPLL